MRRTSSSLYHHFNQKIVKLGNFNINPEITVLTKRVPDPTTYYNEVNSLIRLQGHDGIAKLLDYDKYKQTIDTPYYHDGDLLEYIKDKGRLEEEEALGLIKKILQSLQYCHEMNVVHGDIKPDNIVLNKKYNNIGHFPILIDFGHSCTLPYSENSYNYLPSLHKVNYNIGTPQYMAPELNEHKVSTTSDIYSTGIMLYTMLVGKHPVISDMGELDVNFETHFNINHKLVNLIIEMTDVDYRQRPSAEDILYLDIF